jgi:hypothetical protein
MAHALVHQHHVLNNCRPQRVGQLFIFKEGTGNTLQGL